MANYLANSGWDGRYIWGREVDVAGRAGKRAIVMNVPNTYPARALNGLLVSGFVAVNLERAVYPAELLPRLRRHDYRIDVDQESIAQGMANAGAGVFQGIPVSTSLSPSSLNESAGARTQVSSLALTKTSSGRRWRTASTRLA